MKLSLHQHIGLFWMIGAPGVFAPVMENAKRSDAEAIQERIRENIVATNDMRLFGLLHLLGQASLRMEQALWPQEYDRMTRAVEKSLREANDPNARLYPHDEVMQAMQERIDQARDKPC